MFGTVLTAAFTALLLYVFYRVSSLPFLSGRVSRQALLAVGGVFWAVFFLARVYGHHGTGPVALVLEQAGMTLLGTVFVTSAALLAADLATLFGFLFNRWVAALRSGALGAGILLSVIALVQGHRVPEVVSHQVALADLPAELDGAVLVAVSDAHLGAVLGQEWFTERVAQIRALRPDLVAFLGDMFEGHGHAPPKIPGLRELEAPLGKWFVEGNHESHGHGDGSSRALREAGFRLLDDRWQQIAPGLIAAGVSDLTTHRRRNRRGDPLGRALGGRPAGATLLFSHTPWQAERAARAGVGLMLSGHTHGGQIWPFGYLVQTRYPLLAGRYEVEGMAVIVSRGVGTWGPRMRLWRPGEILKITLRNDTQPRPGG